MSKEDPDRAARLAEALRTNLRRRKAQSRAQESETVRDDTVAEDDAAAPREERPAR
ncbi:hypothetical protein [Sphingomonas nostoxanthinifaciens]|uniref:hypothetical protein n=1 Tax=Sphingomonas nostoxanthinifaciens TaxID=2872652 RepID=UPI001CC1FE02|nr:hypothetical protein [Sphingomonas nostoxanthinifaciens]UAK25315.1 hypothetical protein K8P63_03770 [Sphingomonas nostoxanthinifaciens]